MVDILVLCRIFENNAKSSNEVTETEKRCFWLIYQKTFKTFTFTSFLMDQLHINLVHQTIYMKSVN